MTVVRDIKETKDTEKEEENTIRIAVYGSLRQGLSNHGVIADEELLGSFETQPIYSMYSVQEYFPALKEGGTTSIKMEVYEVDEYTFEAVNRLEGYHGEGHKSNHYNRKEIDTPYGKAFVYIYNYPVADLHLVEGGDWTKYKKTSKIINTIAQC